jgi:hypothetical protein
MVENAKWGLILRARAEAEIGEGDGCLFPTHAKRRHMWATGGGWGKDGKSKSNSKSKGKSRGGDR